MQKLRKYWIVIILVVGVLVLKLFQPGGWHDLETMSGLSNANAECIGAYALDPVEGVTLEPPFMTTTQAIETLQPYATLQGSPSLGELLAEMKNGQAKMARFLSDTPPLRGPNMRDYMTMCSIVFSRIRQGDLHSMALGN